VPLPLLLLLPLLLVVLLQQHRLVMLLPLHCLPGLQPQVQPPAL
jgi:hypothetical protein